MSVKIKFALLFSFIFLNYNYSFGQNYRELNESEIIFKAKKDNKEVNFVVTKDDFFLTSGFYKIINEDRFTLFQIGDSGLIIGSYKFYDKNSLYREILWEKGKLVREFIFLSNRLALEKYDSLVNVKTYDSVSNKWKNQKKTISIEKEYPSWKKEILINFTNGPSNSYARYYYQFGKLVREIIPHLFEKKYDTLGNISLFIDYNWDLKQIVTCKFEKGKLVSKEIFKNKYIVWNKKGYLQEPENEKLGKESTLIEYYKTGNVKQKLRLKIMKLQKFILKNDGKIKKQINLLRYLQKYKCYNR